ncbi:MAG: hypothetical protein RLZZ458_3521, partial [Planctomycetota bacterium]
MTFAGTGDNREGSFGSLPGWFSPQLVHSRLTATLLPARCHLFHTPLRDAVSTPRQLTFTPARLSSTFARQA